MGAKQTPTVACSAHQVRQSDEGQTQCHECEPGQTQQLVGKPSVNHARQECGNTTGYSGPALGCNVGEFQNERTVQCRPWSNTVPHCHATLYEDMYLRGATAEVTACNQWVTLEDQMKNKVSSLVVEGRGCYIKGADGDSGYLPFHSPLYRSSRLSYWYADKFNSVYLQCPPGMRVARICGSRLLRVQFFWDHFSRSSSKQEECQEL